MTLFFVCIEFPNSKMYFDKMGEHVVLTTAPTPKFFLDEFEARKLLKSVKKTWNNYNIKIKKVVVNELQ